MEWEWYRYLTRCSCRWYREHITGEHVYVVGILWLDGVEMFMPEVTEHRSDGVHDGGYSYSSSDGVDGVGVLVAGDVFVPRATRHQMV